VRHLWLPASGRGPSRSSFDRIFTASSDIFRQLYLGADFLRRLLSLSGTRIPIYAIFMVASDFVLRKRGKAPEFTVCTSTYALCTGAPCTPLADAPGFDACNCGVVKGYSAGQALCQAVQETGEGQAIVSRYYPITSYTPCSNDRPWAKLPG
jgi:hypothetical protein